MSHEKLLAAGARISSDVMSATPSLASVTKWRIVVEHSTRGTQENCAAQGTSCSGGATVRLSEGTVTENNRRYSCTLAPTLA